MQIYTSCSSLRSNSMSKLFFLWFLVPSSNFNGPAERLSKLIELSLSILNRLLLLKPRDLPPCPLEQALTSHTTGLPHQPHLIGLIAGYIYHRHNPRLPTLATLLLKRVAMVAPMSIFGCLGSQAAAIRDIYLSRLQARSEVRASPWLSRVGKSKKHPGPIYQTEAAGENFCACSVGVIWKGSVVDSVAEDQHKLATRIEQHVDTSSMVQNANVMVEWSYVADINSIGVLKYVYKSWCIFKEISEFPSWKPKWFNILFTVECVN